MINNRLLRSMDLKVNMQRINRTIKTGATFGTKDAFTSVLTLTLYKESVLDLTDCTVVVNMLKPDGTKIVHSADILDAKKGEIAIGMTEQCLSVLGEIICELVIYSDMQILYSPKFSFEVVDNLFDESGIESATEYPLLNTLIRDVQSLEAHVEQLAFMIDTKEGERALAESVRKSNELERQSSMRDIEGRTNVVITNANNKIKDMDTEIQKSVDVTISNTQKIDMKITETNAKIVEINNTIADVLNQLDGKKSEVDSKVNAKISEVDNKIVEINSTITTLTQRVDDKLLYVDDELAKKFAAIDVLVVNKLNQVDAKMAEIEDVKQDLTASVDAKLEDMATMETTVINSVNAKLNETDVKISEIVSTKNDLVNDVDAKLSETDGKISECSAKITDMNNIKTNLEIAETSREQAENDRENTFNNLVSELEITQTDIDDIIGMVGGL